eukprot:scaffold37895_cov79-Phaeocystis_antarctica.AAC.1
MKRPSMVSSEKRLTPSTAKTKSSSSSSEPTLQSDGSDETSVASSSRMPLARRTRRSSRATRKMRSTRRMVGLKPPIPEELPTTSSVRSTMEEHTRITSKQFQASLK